MTDAYLNEHASDKAALNVAIANAVQHLPGVGADEAQDVLKQTCAKLIYDAKLSRTGLLPRLPVRFSCLSQPLVFRRRARRGVLAAEEVVDVGRWLPRRGASAVVVVY